jgi:putative redox protein
MQTCTRYLGGKKFESLIGGHRIVSDQPMSEGGAGAGVTAPELLLASLGGCAGHYAVEYLRARSLPTEGLHVYVSAEKGERPARLTSFRIEVDVPDLDERQRQGVWRAVKTCLIHNTLTTLPPIEVVVSGDTQELTRRGCTSVAALPHQ